MAKLLCYNFYNYLCKCKLKYYYISNLYHINFILIGCYTIINISFHLVLFNLNTKLISIEEKKYNLKKIKKNK